MAKQKPKKAAGSPAAKQSVAAPFNADRAGYLLLGLILVVVSAVRIHLLTFPLERDEGEYAYFGQLILQGIPPYKMAYNLKLPGTYYMYALFMSLFGQTDSGIRIGLLLMNLGSVLLLFYIGRKLFSNLTGSIAAALYGILSISPAFLAQAAHATHFVTFFALGGTLLLLNALEKRNLLLFFSSGVMMGLSFVMKQSGVFFPLFGGLMVVLTFFLRSQKEILKALLQLLVYAGGALLPFLLVVVLMRSAGVFDSFWFWTMTYPSTYSSRIPFSEAWKYFSYAVGPIFKSFWFPWVAGMLGLATLPFLAGKKDQKLFAFLFLVFSFLPAVPGFYFRQHYFIPLLPAAGLMGGILFEFIREKYGAKAAFAPYLALLLVMVFIATDLSRNKSFYFTGDPQVLCKQRYQVNPFAESPVIGKFLASNSKEDDRIMVLGSEPQIYFYAQRRSATGYIYMYDLVFDHPNVKRMQSEMFHEVEKADPKYLVFVKVPYSWLVETAVADTVFRWMNHYIADHRYMPVMVADMIPGEKANYVYGEEALNYRVKNETFITVLRREDSQESKP